MVRKHRRSTMNVQRTAAETVSALLHDDGQNWTADDGRDLDTLARDHDARHEHRAHRGGGTGDDIYTFADGSRIIRGQGRLGLGFADVDCTCWADETGSHREDCPYADPEYPDKYTTIEYPLSGERYAVKREADGMVTQAYGPLADSEGNSPREIADILGDQATEYLARVPVVVGH
jgi:hypothetical protein